MFMTHLVEETQITSAYYTLSQRTQRERADLSVGGLKQEKLHPEAVCRHSARTRPHRDTR